MKAALALAVVPLMAGCFDPYEQPTCLSLGMPDLGLAGQNGTGRVDVPFFATGPIVHTDFAWSNQTDAFSQGIKAEPMHVMGGWHHADGGSAFRGENLWALALDCPQTLLGAVGTGPLLSAPPSVDAGDGVHLRYAAFQADGALVATNVPGLAGSWRAAPGATSTAEQARVFVYGSSAQERDAGPFGLGCLGGVACYATVGPALNAALADMAEGEARLLASDEDWPGGDVVFVQVLRVVAAPCYEEVCSP